MIMGRFHSKAHFLDVSLANGYSGSTTTTTTTTTCQPHIYSASTSYITPLRLVPKEETTRISLQRQRHQEQNAKTLVSTSSIPGYKTSAAFFGSLRTNLRLHASPPSSPLSTPNSMRGSTTTLLPPPSPLSGPVLTLDMDPPDTPLPHDNVLDGVPELSSYVATDEFEKREAMKLVADSVAQQRQAANRALLSHPLNVSVGVGLLGWLARYMLDAKYDFMTTSLTCMGILMAMMAACRYATQDYIRAAEEINYDWLGDADILVTKFGDEVIGTVMVEWVSGESRTKKKKAWRGYIRAWTVRLKYRGKGVGGALLEDAANAAKKKGAESLEFAEDHANSRRVLPRLYNGRFNRAEAKAIDQLQDLMETSPKRGGKRRLTN